MNGLKKFQEFALNADEQKNVKGGKIAPERYLCSLSNGGTIGVYANSPQGLFDHIDAYNAVNSNTIVGCDL